MADSTPIGFRKAPRAAGLILLGVAAFLRVGYVLAQRGADPALSAPSLDAAYYLDWARAIVSGTGGPAGAYYLAPLYPNLLALFLRLFGEQLALLFVIQQAVMIGAAWLLGRAAERVAGAWAGVGTMALVALYHPSIFFASRAVGESIAALFLALAVRATIDERPAAGAVGGFASGIAALARPNLLLVPAAWAVELLGRRDARWKRGLFVLAGVAVAIAPVAVRNLAVSGHPVLVSSNGGLTLYHGNGPGSLGIFNPPDGFSGILATQREEATALARLRSGKPLDDVEADRWWGREALRMRLANPLDSLRLLGTRLLLVVDDYEHGLDDSPMLDTNPWRLTLRLTGEPGDDVPARQVSLIPFALILGLACAAVVAVGFRGSGGWIVWSAIACCAATPILFYVSSRYRLPAAVLLAVPGGIGLSVLLGDGLSSGRRVRAAAAGLACAAISFLVPFDGLRRAEEAGALSNRAAHWKRAGNLDAAERSVRAAVAIDPESSHARFALAVVLEARGRRDEAETEYREVVRRDPGHAEAAGNLAKLLTERGRSAEAVPVLRSALAMRPTHGACWTNLVVALAAAGDLDGARRAAGDAARLGVALEPGLLREIGYGSSAGGTQP